MDIRCNHILYRHSEIVLGVQLELVLQYSTGRSPPAGRVWVASISSRVEGGVAASVVLSRAGILTDRAIDLEEATDERFQEGCACRDDADIELKAVCRTRQ